MVALNEKLLTIAIMDRKATGLVRSDGVLFVLVSGFRADDFTDMDYTFDGDENVLHVFLTRPDEVTEQIGVDVQDEAMIKALQEGFESVVVTDPANITID